MLARLNGADLELLMDSIGTPTFLVGVKGADDFVILYGNKELQKSLALSPKALRNRPSGTVVPLEQARVFRHYYHQCWLGGEPVTFEAALQVPIGQRWLRITLSPVRDDSGAVVRMLGTVIDVTEERRAQEASRYQHLLLRAQQDLSPDGIMIDEINGTILSWNARFMELWGLTEADLRQGRSALFALILSQLVDASSAEAKIKSLYHNLRAELAGEEVELRNGKIYLMLSRSLIDDNNLGRGRIWFVRDITESKRHERDLAQANALQKAILGSAHQIILAVDHNMVFRSFNAAAERLLGYTAEELVGKATPILLHDPAEIEERRIALSQEWGREASVIDVFRGRAPSGVPEIQNWNFVRKDGRRIPVELSLTRLTDDEGNNIGYLGIATDITERQETERRLFELATTDGLTKLWNRRHFTEQAEKTLLRAGRYDDHICLALIDIDFFKRINDTYGHSAGDVVLAEVAQVLNNTLRRSDFMCRWGGEEFAALLVNTGQEEAMQIAERMREAVATLAVRHGGIQIPATISIGLSDCLSCEQTLDAIISRADEALYAAKEAGRNRVRALWGVQPDGQSAGMPAAVVQPRAGSA